MANCHQQSNAWVVTYSVINHPDPNTKHRNLIFFQLVQMVNAMLNLKIAVKCRAAVPFWLSFDVCQSCKYVSWIFCSEAGGVSNSLFILTCFPSLSLSLSLIQMPTGTPCSVATLFHFPFHCCVLTFTFTAPSFSFLVWAWLSWYRPALSFSLPLFYSNANWAPPLSLSPCCSHFHFHCTKFFISHLSLTLFILACSLSLPIYYSVFKFHLRIPIRPP